MITQTFAERLSEATRTLKRCPFCDATGCKPTNVVVDDSSVNDFSTVFCDECGARGPKTECWESACDKWNDRRDRVAEEMEVEFRMLRKQMNDELAAKRQRD